LDERARQAVAVSSLTMSRVRIAELTADDGPEFVGAMRASAKLHRPWLEAATNATAFNAMFERTQDDTFYSLLARRREDGAIVGFFNISNIVRRSFQSAFLGYGGSAVFAGQGYMSEAMQLALRYAFVDLGLHRLEANIQPGNAASIALARRSGFAKEGFSERYLKIGGRWRDHERWAIRAEQWREFRREHVG